MYINYSYVVHVFHQALLFLCATFEMLGSRSMWVGGNFWYKNYLNGYYFLVWIVVCTLYSVWLR